MNKIRLVLLGLILAVAHPAYAFDDGDFQIWHTENQDFKIKKDLKAALEEEFRFGDSAHSFYYHHYDIGLVYDLNKHLSLGVNYRQVYEKKGGKFREENRPHANAILKFDLSGFKLEDRNRIQYRHFDYQTDYWQYRNKLTVKFPLSLTQFEIQPFLADEIFIDLNDNGFSRNRFYSGFGFKIIKNLKGEIYYLLQSSKGSSKWTDANVFGTKLKIAF